MVDDEVIRNYLFLSELKKNFIYHSSNKYLMIVIIDYGMGNLGSIKNMLKKIGEQVIIASEPELIQTADKIILPGVGAFDKGIQNISNLGLINLLSQLVMKEKIPILGICLGMQIMTKKSEEGVLPGLGWIDAQTIRFEVTSSNRLKVPNMGWNILQLKHSHKLFSGLERDSWFYFVHSYYVSCNNIEDIITTTHYGVDFVSAFSRENIFGVQFHPEKSLKYGMRFLKNFAECEM